MIDFSILLMVSEVLFKGKYPIYKHNLQHTYYNKYIGRVRWMTSLIQLLQAILSVCAYDEHDDIKNMLYNYQNDAHGSMLNLQNTNIQYKEQKLYRTTCSWNLEHCN